MGFFTALGSVTMLFSLILIGFICRKTNLVSQGGQKDLTNLVLYVLLPATVIKAMTKDISSETIDSLVVMIGITFISYIFISILAYLISRKFNLPDNQKDVMFGGMAFSNITFMGLPIQEALFGIDAVFLTILSQLAIFEFYCWSVGLSILEKHKKGGKFHISIKEVLKKPGIVACIVGIFLMLTKIKPPKLALDIVNILAKGTSPLAMITIGFMLANSNIKKAIKNKYLYISSFVKLILIPLIMIGILYLIGIKGLRMAIPVLEMGMPTAAYLAMLSELAENDTTLASEQIMISSLFSMVSIPIIVSILTYVM